MKLGISGLARAVPLCATCAEGDAEHPQIEAPICGPCAARRWNAVRHFRETSAARLARLARGPHPAAVALGWVNPKGAQAREALAAFAGQFDTVPQGRAALDVAARNAGAGPFAVVWALALR